MNKGKINALTGSYDKWLINSLRNKEEATIFLEVAFEEYQKDNNVEALLLSIRYVAEAQGGLGYLANKTHLNRESLYKTLSKKGNPKLQTVGSVLKGLGYKLSIKCA